MAQDAARPLDVDTLLDESSWSTKRLLLIVLIALAMVFDAFDNQLLGLAAPTIQQEFGIGKDVLATIFAAGLVGVTIGSVLAGRLGDVIGRRIVILGCIVCFSVPSILISRADSVTHLMILRFIAGIGLGGFMPVALTLIAEFTPARWRSMVVMSAVACIPVGGIVAGAVSARWMDVLGWRTLFVIGGASPLVFSLFLLGVLPESPKFLVDKRADPNRVRRALSRLNIAVPPQATFTAPAFDVAKHRPSEIFRNPYRRDTIALCIAFFFSLLNSYTNQSWLPSTLSLLGMDVADRGMASAISSAGGLVGILFGAIIMMRFGSRWPLTIFCLGAIVCAVALTQADVLFATHPAAVFFLLAMQAALMGLVQAALFSLAAHIFPAPLRSTGIGVSSGVGRLGAVMSAFTAAWALQSAGADGYFIAIGIGTAVVLFALLAIRGHVPKA